MAKKRADGGGQGMAKAGGWVQDADIGDFKQDAHNFNKGRDEGQRLIEKSFSELGAGRSILVDRNNNIIAGNKSQKAAIKAGIKRVRVIETDGTELIAVRRTDVDIDSEEGRKLALADNSTTAANLDWDIPEMESELDRWGIDAEEWGVPDFGDGTVEGVEGEDDSPEANADEPPDSERGAVYTLGNHRLMCGDSTDAAAVKKLMGGERADICFTSPPYNMKAAQQGNWDRTPKPAMHNGKAYVGGFSDSLSDDEYAALLTSALKNALASADDALFNIGILGGSKSGIIRMLADFEKNFCDIIVWNKKASMPSGLPAHKSMISHRCELIFCFNQTGTRSFSHPQWEIGTEINRIDTENASGNEFSAIHSATFPVALPEYVCRKYTESSVIDLFGGTGTTMIAAEKSGRKCYMMEMDARYCDVIRRRWAEFVHGEGCDWKALTPRVEG